MNSKIARVMPLVFLLFASCVEQGKSLPTARLIIQTAGGERELIAEIADDDKEREYGLMNRAKVKEGTGMLFVFPADQMLAFWMKNTSVPLSIAYIAADGRILEIHDMTPLSLIPIQSSRSARYALEVPQGWFKREAISAGDRVLIPEL